MIDCKWAKRKSGDGKHFIFPNMMEISLCLYSINIMIIRERNLELKLNVKFLIWMKYQNGFQTSFAVRIRGLGLDISNMFHHFNYSLTLSFFLFNRFLVYFNNYISIVCVQIFVKYISWSWLRFLVEKNFTIWDSLLKIWYGTNKSE